MLVAGIRLGPYEILAPLGAGGMGEVYKARDTRLERVVAIKVLPPERCASPEARQRFEREARTVSQLSHPHICALYDVGRQDTPQGTVDYLVIEYLEGETLAARLAKGPLALDQVLLFGRQIADALQRAHRQGIVHRDLKPANVMLTRGGLKLLDFGLARSDGPVGIGDGRTAAPTRTHLTQEGTILGTLQYMAPEQLEGKEADARTDLFALGAVLYEMATGTPAFAGTSQASLISAIMKDEPPPMARLAPMTPPALDHLVRTCLAKDPDDRWQSAGDLKTQLAFLSARSGSDVAATVRAGGPAGRPGAGRRREYLAWSLATLALVVAVGALLRVAARPEPRPRSPKNLSIVLPGMTAIRSLALSPDGSRIALVARDAQGRNLLWMRPLDTPAPRPLAGTENPSAPFWSPDGRFIAYFADGKLKKIAADGGPPQTICDAPLNRGGAWGADGTILFAPIADGPLYRVPSSGGSPVRVTEFDRARGETTHRWPVFLPDGRRFLYLVATFTQSPEQDRMGIYVRSLGSKEETFVQRTHSSFAWAPPDTLVYLSERTLYAQRVDTATMTPSGDPRPIAGPIQFFPQIYKALFSLSESGTLVYQSPGGSSLGELTWFDRAGRELGKLGAPADQSSPRIAPDGRRVALAITDAQSGNIDVWSYDIPGGLPARLTSYPGADGGPLWSPDGSRIAFISIRGHPDTYVMNARGDGSERALFASERANYPTDWSPDGRSVMVRMYDSTSNLELWTVPVEGAEKPTSFIRGPFGADGGRFSPDGRFVAYASNETGRWEISVAPFPGPGGNWRVSSGGGSQPVWRRDGKELFFVAADGSLMALPVRLTPAFEAGTPKPLFPLRLREPVATIEFSNYDVAPDGQRFLVNTASETTPPPLTVLLDWASDQPR